MRRQGIHQRLARLERRLDRRPFPRRVFTLFDRKPEDVIGVAAEAPGGATVTVLRLPDEALPRLYERAFGLTGALAIRELLPATADHQSQAEGTSYATA